MTKRAIFEGDLVSDISQGAHPGKLTTSLHEETRMPVAFTPYEEGSPAHSSRKKSR